MTEKREVHIDDVKKLVGKILTLIEATVPAGNQEAAKQLAIQTIWQTFNVVGEWGEHEPKVPSSN